MANVERQTRYVEFVTRRTGTEKVADVIVSIVTAFAVLLIPTGMWFCFDDHLAELVGIPGLGEIPFWSVYAFCHFWVFLMRRTKLNYSDWKVLPKGVRDGQ